MLRGQFNDINSIFVFGFGDQSKMEMDPRWTIVGLIDGFNETERQSMAPSTKLLSELMLAWKPQTRKTGGFPNVFHPM